MTDQNNFRYQTFFAVFGNPGGKISVVENVVSSHEQDFYPTTSLGENSIVFEFQIDRNVYVDFRQMYLAVKFKQVKVRGLILKKQQKGKKSTKETLFLLKQMSMTLNL